MTFTVRFDAPKPVVVEFRQLAVGQVFTVADDKEGLFMKTDPTHAVVLQKRKIIHAASRGEVTMFFGETVVNPVAVECIVKFI